VYGTKSEHSELMTKRVVMPRFFDDLMKKQILLVILVTLLKGKTKHQKHAENCTSATDIIGIWFEKKLA